MSLSLPLLPVAVADCCGDTNPQDIFTYLMGSISGTRKLCTQLWHIADCIWKCTIKMLGVWAGCGASDQSFCQAEGPIYGNFFTAAMPSAIGMSSKKRERGEVLSPLPGYYQEPFLLFSLNGKTCCFSFISQQDPFLWCVCKLPLETLGKRMFWAWDPVSSGVMALTMDCSTGNITTACRFTGIVCRNWS